ncbi:putative Ig domain-containing protein [Shewanella seohaensis]|uniref:putative Ig domain-containing protein n=1 Tax=Shewanella seohaensis TaxID=755175 RepID=UPI00200D5EB8|nr:putative Ig domain-containing protein [Shewanella seohaensis]MCL1119265.1 putative Ig domain-containing protein [Shewanella seohaensis]UXM81861.1 putative Ig domain-containing protein [Shewanella seohaensis]
MAIKMSHLCVCISIALAPACIDARPVTNAFGKLAPQHVGNSTQEKSQFDILLAGKSEWQGGNRQDIQLQQQQLIAQIQSLDSSAKILTTSSKAINSLHVEMSASAAQTIKANREVKAVSSLQSKQLEQVSKAMPSATKGVATTSAPRATAVGKAPALSDDPLAGKGTVIAILSTGIDYTHATLGGAGTAAAYDEAKINNTAEFDGFPTDLVIAGRDYSSEFGWGEDPNPLDSDMSYVNPVSGFEFPTGRGTMIASLIHQQAPGAKLLAYKMAGLSDPWGSGPSPRFPSHTDMAAAMEDAVEKGANIIVVDQSVYGGNFAAYYDPNDPNSSGAIFDHIMVNSIASKGVLVVVSAGYYGELPTKYNIGNLGATAESLTVGAVESLSDDLLATTAWTPHGPVRGIQTLKPDLVTYASEETVALVGGAAQTLASSEKEFPVARMAAAAAILKASRDVSAVEVKALLANTANHTIQRGDSGQRASVTQIGTGVENLEAALNSPVAVWEHSSYQPNLTFGQQLVSGKARLIKEVALKNYSDSAKTYTLAIEVAPDREGNAAINWSFPAKVTVPAKSTLSVPVILEIDAAKLPMSKLNNTEDFGIDAWEQFELNGYLTLSAEQLPTLSMGWSVFPRPEGKIRREFNTYNDGIWELPKTLPWAQETFAVKQAFTNINAYPAHMMALPVVASQPNLPAGFENTNNMIKHVAAAVMPEAQCSVSGQKYAIAVQMHGPMDISVSGHMDKFGDMLLENALYSEAVIDMYGLAESFDPFVDFSLSNAERVANLRVYIDDNGKPQTVIADYSSDDPWWMPAPPPKISSLPTYFTPGGDTVVAQACLEDMYHHGLNSPATFDQQMAFVIGTDRDVMPTANGKSVMFNPVKFGSKYVTSEFDWSTGDYVDKERYSTAMINMNRLDSDGAEGAQWQWEMTLAPNESAMLWAFRDSWCEAGGAWSVPNTKAGIQAVSPGACSLSDFLLMDLNSNMVIAAKQQRDGSIQNVEANQVFEVEENTPEGKEIGTLSTTINGFFGEANSQWTSVNIVQMGAIPGNPIAVSPEGVITVANAAALDYENLKSITLKVQTERNNIVGTVTDVIINLVNANDVAPLFKGPFSTFSVEEGKSYEYSLAGYFTDVEGDELTIAVSGLPDGMSFNASTMMISGTPTKPGTFVAQVTASDGVNQTSASLNGEVVAKPASSSGGGTGFGVLPLLLLGLLRRKQ